MNKIHSNPEFGDSTPTEDNEEEKDDAVEEEEEEKVEKKDDKETEEEEEEKDKKDDETEETEEEEKKNDEEENEEEDIEDDAEKKDEEETEEEDTGAEKKYYFNGKTLTADELFAEANGLQIDHTQKSQDLSKEKDKNEEEEILKKFKPEEVETFRSLAKALGFVSKEEIAKTSAETTQKGIVANFLKTHPGYTKEKDPTGQNYVKLQSQLRKYNLSLDNLEWALNKAHDDLAGGKGTAEAKQLANAAKLKRSGVHGGGSAGGGKGKNSKYTPAQIEVMKKMGVYEEKD